MTVEERKASEISLFFLKHSQRSGCSSPSQSESSPPSYTHNSLTKCANYSDRSFVDKQMPIQHRWEASDDVSFPEQEAKDNEVCQMSCLRSEKMMIVAGSAAAMCSTAMESDHGNQHVHRKTLWNPHVPVLLFARQRFKTSCASPAKFPERSRHPVEPH